MIERNENQVMFLDVAHGDSSVIIVRNQKGVIDSVIIVDLPDSKAVIKRLEEHNIKKVNLILISHSDADHCKELGTFVDSFCQGNGRIESICINIDRTNASKVVSKLLRSLLEYRDQYGFDIQNGMIPETKSTYIQQRLTTSTSIKILYPNPEDNFAAYSENSTNDMSIVLTLECEGTTVLFTGDLGPNGWQRLATRYGIGLSCDIIKMPHHGAFYGQDKAYSTYEILNITKPKIAIILSGENERYKHPSKETILELKRQGIEVYCTEYTSLCSTVCEDRRCYGTIEIDITDSGYNIKTECINGDLQMPCCMLGIT